MTNKNRNILGVSICISFYIIHSYLRVNSMALFRDGLWLEIQDMSLLHYMSIIWKSNYLMKWAYLTSFVVIIWSRIRITTKIFVLTNLALLTMFFFWGVRQANLFPMSSQEQCLIKMYFIDPLQGQLPFMTAAIIALVTFLVVEIKISCVGMR